jgi:hypothetical protein
MNQRRNYFDFSENEINEGLYLDSDGHICHFAGEFSDSLGEAVFEVEGLSPPMKSVSSSDFSRFQRIPDARSYATRLEHKLKFVREKGKLD